MLKTEKTVASQLIYTGKILELRVDQVELPSGKIGQRELVKHPGAVAIAAITPERELVLVSQYRKPVEKELLEIPAGKLEPGEDPLVCAQRELKEETGYQAGNWQLVSRYFTTPGFSNEVMYFFRATELKAARPELEEDEFIEVELVPLTKAREMVQSGRIEDAKTIIGILMAEPPVLPGYLTQE